MRVFNATLVAFAASLAASAANADTVATFADPASTPATPLFSFNSVTGVLTGGWTGTGLLLQTPGLPAPDFANARFAMTPISSLSNFGGFYNMGAGQLNFVDSSNNPLLTISFASATMTYALGLGASDFVGNGVTFSGPIVGAFPLISNEAFSFSFANPVGVGPVNTQGVSSFTVTSSFTSSATIPAPGAMALLGVGGLMATRRRR